MKCWLYLDPLNYYTMRLFMHGFSESGYIHHVIFHISECVAETYKISALLYCILEVVQSKTIANIILKGFCVSIRVY